MAGNRPAIKKGWQAENQADRLGVFFDEHSRVMIVKNNQFFFIGRTKAEDDRSRFRLQTIPAMRDLIECRSFPHFI